MRVKILGSAAGGAFPQWNCACRNCSALRSGSFGGKARSQAEIAISADGNTWFLLGASPDLRAQIESTPELHPGAGLRQSPVRGAVLLNADVDHVLGLLLLRELQPLCVFATESIRRILTEDNSMFAMLQRVPEQVRWSDFVPGNWFSLADPSGHDSKVRCRALSLGEHFPAYVSAARRAQLSGGELSLGLLVEASSGKRLAYVPAVPHITNALREEFEGVGVLLFDG